MNSASMTVTGLSKIICKSTSVNVALCDLFQGLDGVCEEVCNNASAEEDHCFKVVDRITAHFCYKKS